MQIDLLPTNLVLQPEHKSWIVRRIGFALLRLARRIRRIEVRLTDVNGPRGGINDKRCRVLMHLPGGAPLVVEQRGSELRELIDRTLACAGHAARKRIEQSSATRYAARSLRRFAL